MAKLFISKIAKPIKNQIVKEQKLRIKAKSN